jgi:hypothetical protein
VNRRSLNPLGERPASVLYQLTKMSAAEINPALPNPKIQRSELSFTQRNTRAHDVMIASRTAIKLRVRGKFFPTCEGIAATHGTSTIGYRPADQRHLGIHETYQRNALINGQVRSV